MNMHREIDQLLFLKPSHNIIHYLIHKRNIFTYRYSIYSITLQIGSNSNSSSDGVVDHNVFLSCIIMI